MDLLSDELRRSLLFHWERFARFASLFVETNGEARSAPSRSATAPGHAPLPLSSTALRSDIDDWDTRSKDASRGSWPYY